MDELDMKSYAGELMDSAAEGQQEVGVNSYEETQEYPVQEEFLDKPSAQEVQGTPSKQELNFKALREEVDRIKTEREAERREYQMNLEMMRANLNQQHPQPIESPKTSKMFEGMDDHEVPNVKEIRQAWEQREADYQARIEELQVVQTHPDYAEVIQKYTAPLIKQKPHLAEGIYGAKNKALFAYELGKMYQQQQQAATPPSNMPSANAQRIVENSRKPGTLSSAGGQGSLSKADYYATMSDVEFMKMAARNLGEI